ncbi:MAG: prepilin-type N-terminal cleavage/methylation protein [Akkermansiaceae bacterium]|nr:prepilin-type N-terminal cleavage/methylation protein [Akkermansiaceae bacterium]
MKITHTRSLKSAKGMTLLELTVVILVLLSLISILFVGARAWKKGSDRAANIMNIRNTQQAMRGYQNMYQKQEGAAFVTADLTNYVKFPTEPNKNLTYAPGTVITTPGVFWLGVTGTDAAAMAPDATTTADW